MMIFILAYFVCLISYLGLDMLWLLGLGRPFYIVEIGGLLREQPNLLAAIVFYLIYALGLTFFAISPSIKASSPMMALGYGALFGLVSYATYDLTNLAVMNGFTLRIALIDMAWGASLSAATAWAVNRALHLAGMS